MLSPPSPLRLTAIVVVAALGSMVNAIAGGGTLLTFPSLIALGIPPIVANATSTVALWPGALGSMLGYRRHIEGMRDWAAVFAVPSLVGGGVGGWLLLHTSNERFSAIVPWLVLGATTLFAVQAPVMKRLRAHRHGDAPHWTLPTLACQFLVGVYGGYFGAGIGILMLAVLGFMGFTDIHRMNGLKNWGGLCINFVAAAMFAASGLVNWVVALAMAIGATIGGYIASRAAQRVPQAVVRRIIVGIGMAAGVWLYYVRL